MARSAESVAAAQDAVLELLGAVIVGGPELVEAAVARACRGASGVTVPFLAAALVRELSRDGYSDAVARLQALALEAKAARDVPL